MAKKPTKSTKSKAKKPAYKVTQSLMKSLYDYREGKECGLVLEAKFLNNRWDEFVASDTQALGTWFEYILTEAVPKNGEIPEPERTQKGELTAAYKKMEVQAANFKKLMKFHHIEIVEVGYDLIHKDLKGTLDLLCKAKMDIVQDGEVIVKKGKLFIVDIKSTGLLDDFYHEYGWNLDNLHSKVRIILQPIHYKYIAQQVYGEDLPFLFFLFSTKDENDYRIIRFEMDEMAVAEHEVFIQNTRQWMDYSIRNGWKAHPEVDKCAKCPLKVGCKHFIAIPPIKTFYYGGTT